MFIQPGNPNSNAFVERFNRTFRYEVLDVNLFAKGITRGIAKKWVENWCLSLALGG